MGPLLPIAGLVGLGSVAEVVDAVAPPPERCEIVATARPAEPASGSGWPTGQMPAPLWAGVYGEMAWRGWQMIHRLERQPQVARLARTIGQAASRWADRFESVADELHDTVEEVLGQILTRAYHDHAPSSAA